MTDRIALNNKYGDPFKDRPAFTKNMKLWNVQDLFPWFPQKHMYLNKDLISLLINTFTILEAKDLHTEIKKFDGCWNVRYIRGYEKKKIASIHSWGLAIDLNARNNPLGLTREQAIEKGLIPFTEEFLEVWRGSGWTVGYDFRRNDGMHFQKRIV